MVSPKELKDALKAGKVVTGRAEVVRAVKKGLLETVLCASNCPKPVFEEMEYYSKLTKAGLDRSGSSSAMLGQLCGKPFSVMVLGIKK